MKKRIMGLLLATAMVVGASMTAVATDSPADIVTADVTTNNVTGIGQQSIDFSGVVKPVTISVEVKSMKAVIVNPYQLQMTYNDLGGANVSSNDTLIAEPIKFENKSNVPIAVNLKGLIVLPDYTKDPAKSAVPNTADRVTVAGSAAAIKTATTKQVFVQATFAKEAAMTNVLWTGTKGATPDKNTFTKAPSVVYTAAVETTAPGTITMTAPPILAAKNKAGAKESCVMYAVIEGGTSVSPVSGWNVTKDTVKVKTVYDLQLVGESKLVSRFAPANAAAADVKKDE